MTPTTADAPGFTERYRVIQSRDRRFDGQFVTAVRSTGIYCRPSCPRAHPEGRERHLLRHLRRRARGGLPRVQEVSARGRSGFAPVGRPGRRRGARHAPHRRRRGRPRGRSGLGAPSRLLFAPPHATALRRARRGSPRARAGPSRPHRAGPAGGHRPVVGRRGLLRRVLQHPSVQRDHRRGLRYDAQRVALPPFRRHAHRGGGGRDRPGAAGAGPIDTVGLFGWMRAHAIPGVEEGGDRSFARVVRLPGGPPGSRCAAPTTTDCACARG